MKCWVFTCAVLLGMLVLPGCGSAPEEAAVSDEPPPTKLEVQSEVNLAELLAKPRAELAALADDWRTKVGIQEQARRDGRLNQVLVPDLRLPLVLPVWRDVKFSDKLDIVLPTHYTDEAKDGTLAVHLARYGDVEAAHKLADPSDAATLAKIEACRGGRNYPAEWTRLVGLMLHYAQVRLSTGDVDGGSELAGLHQQLRELLDARAAQGPLGSVLLSPGRVLLGKAAAAWKVDKRPDLAEQAEAILATWGDVPAPKLPLQPGATRTEVGAMFRSPARGKAVPASDVVRALDLLGVPLPEEGAEAVVAFFDAADRLAEVLVTYRGGINTLFLQPTQLASHLEAYPLPVQDAQTASGMRGRVYQVDNVPCTVTIVAGGSSIGAWVRLGGGKASAALAPLPRDFGAVHLDRSFEHDRRLLAPEQRGDVLTVSSKTLAKIVNPLPALKPGRAELRRDAGQVVTTSLTLRYAEEVAPKLHELALPLWAVYGPAPLQVASDAGGTCLALTWEDGRSRYTLRLPYETTRPPELEVRDAQPADKQAERIAQVAALDRAARHERLTAGRPLVRLPRTLEQITLGLTRSQVLAQLPTGKGIARQDIPGGVTVTFNGEPPRNSPHLARQLFLRFDAASRLTELRARYAENPVVQSKTSWAGELLNSFARTCGASQEMPPTWAAAWPDLPPRRGKPVAYSWQDDITRMTWQRDGSIAEVCLRDCPLKHEDGVPLPPLQALPRGPALCPLGAERGELLKKWNVSSPVTTAEGALVLSPGLSGPYDALLVWFAKERVARVVARHTHPTGGGVAPAQASEAVIDAWGRDLRLLGWPLRQDLSPQDVLQGLTWLDEQTRVRMFWQENDDGSCRVFTEWKDARPEGR